MNGILTALIAETLARLRAERRQVELQLAAVYAKLPGHISDHDLERYHLGMVTGEVELAPLEEHLMFCKICVDRAKEVAEWVSAVREGARTWPLQGRSDGRRRAVPCPTLPAV